MGTQPALLPIQLDGIPPGLREQDYWIGWRGVWLEAKQKYTKVPHHTKGAFGKLSTNQNVGLPFRKAAADFLKAGDKLTGLGYLMNRPHGVVIFDLDHCVENGSIAPWAYDLAFELNSYTEFSPSGTGLRIAVHGDMADGDFNNHAVGIEGYCGSAARFLTITGHRVPGFPADLTTPGDDVLDSIRARYAKKQDQVLLDTPVPDLVADLNMPDIDHDALPAVVNSFLRGEAEDTEDRSGLVHRAAVALFNQGMSAPEVFTALVDNVYIRQVALDHRQQDHEKADIYLWKEHCLKGGPKAATSLIEFENLQPDGELNEIEFEPLPQEPATPAKGPLIPLSEFLKRRPMHWLVKGVMPQAQLGVLFGESGSGKSFMALDLAMALARGVDWRGHRTKRIRVVYVAAEGAAGFRNRVAAYLVAHQLEASEFHEWFRVMDAAPNLMDKKVALQLSKDILAWGRAGVVIVDTFAQTTPGGNENSGEDMGQALSHCKGIHTATKAMVLLIHHSGKDASRGARGWSGLKAAADVELEVTQTITARCLTITKQKDGESGQQFGFTLVKVPLGIDEDGDAFDSCIVAEAAVPVQQPTTDAAGKWAALFAQVVGEITESQTTGIDATHVRNEMASRVADTGKDPTGANRRKIAMKTINKFVDGEEFEWETPPDEAKQQGVEPTFRKV